MELRIMCDAFVEITDAIKISNVKADIKNYYLDDLTLKGNVLITGNYTKYESLDKEYDEEFTFNEEVPFTIVFKSDNYEIVNIFVEDLNYYEVVNQGIKCDFQIVVKYEDKINNEVKNENKENVDLIKDIPITETNIEDENEILSENSNDEDLIDEIKEKYDNLLEEIFATSRNENDDNSAFLDTNIKVKQEDSRVNLSFIKESSGKYRVYYPKQEKEIEKVCNLEKVSINSIYNDDCNKDFSTKRRIIIKK